MKAVTMQPIGIVKSSNTVTSETPLWGQETTLIEVFPEYQGALLRMDEHSHFWILSWFDKACRNLLSVRPERINPDIPEYGVFGIRTPVRPNPIALSLVKLDRIEGNKLYVIGFDAISDTYILDIKPYYEQDVIFSPRAPFLRPVQFQKRYDYMFKLAINQHQEDCLDLRLAIRMGLIAEAEFGQLNAPDLLLEVTGSLCLGDVLQGLTRARLSNPPRFSFFASNEQNKCIWLKDDKRLGIEVKMARASRHHEISDAELFIITMY